MFWKRDDEIVDVLMMLMIMMTVSCDGVPKLADDRVYIFKMILSSAVVIEARY